MTASGLSPGEQAALAYCAPRGIPLSVFLGRVVNPGEAQWLERDTVLALEWAAAESRRCSGCGQNLDETTVDDSDELYDAVGVACGACKAIHRASQIAAGRDDLDPLAGMRYRVERTGER